MPKYKVTATSLIENRLVEPGTIVDYDGHPGKALEPIDAAGKTRKKEFADLRKTQARTDAQLLGEAIADGIANPKKKVMPEDAADPPTVVTAAPGTPTTVGHSSVREVSVGGVDADNLLVADAKGKLVPENPHSDAKPATKADSPDDGKAKDVLPGETEEEAKIRRAGK